MTIKEQIKTLDKKKLNKIKKIMICSDKMLKYQL